ncbi:MAG: CPBP family glutamic-type intramembrane protease [Erysipelotrichaceae bacterium]
MLNVLYVLGFGIGFTFITESISKFSFHLASLVYPSTPYMSIDPYGLYWYISLHHIFQLLLSGGLILFLSYTFKKRFDFFLRIPNNIKKSIQISLYFVLAWMIIQFGVGYALVSTGTVDSTFSYPLNASTLVGQYLFQIVLSGTSEELMYRALIIGILNAYLIKTSLSTSNKVILIYLLNLIPFIVGHIPYQLNPFMVYSPNMLQMLTVITLGSIYTYLLLKFDSIIPPMIVHGLMNVVIISSGFILSMI